MENNYYSLQKDIKVRKTKPHFVQMDFVIIRRHFLNEPRVCLEAALRKIVEAYGYEFKTEREFDLSSDSGGFHSHIPKLVVTRIYDIPLKKALKIGCHEIAHCAQSLALKKAGYEHQGEVALGFDDYFLYERRADLLGYEVWKHYFKGITGCPILTPADFSSYQSVSGVIRLYRKWRDKFRRWVMVLSDEQLKELENTIA